MDLATASLLIVAGISFLLAVGVPLAFSTGALAMVTALLAFGPNSLPLIASRTYSLVSEFVLVAVPMFILMASILERSGVARDLFKAMHLLAGRLRGVTCRGLRATLGLACLLGLFLRQLFGAFLGASCHFLLADAIQVGVSLLERHRLDADGDAPVVGLVFLDRVALGVPVGNLGARIAETGGHELHRIHALVDEEPYDPRCPRGRQFPVRRKHPGVDRNIVGMALDRYVEGIELG